MKKQWLAFLVCMVLVLSACLFTACTVGETSGGDQTPDGGEATKGLAYILLADGTYAVTGIGTFTGTALVIPSTYNGKPVTSIGDAAFSGCTGLTSVTIPEGVTSIGHVAFRRCTGPTSVTIPSSVTSIGCDAFEGCTNLTYNEYGNAYYLGNESQPYLWLIKAKNTSITSCEIHESTKGIAGVAFEGCTGLTSVTIPAGVTSIGDDAFEDCTGLTSVTIPEGVTSIGEEAFVGCTGLTSVTIPESVTSIGDAAFSGCTGLTSVTIPASVTSIGYDAFEDCTGLTSVTFANTTGWYVTQYISATSGTSVTVTDAARNAKYLTNTYSRYYWKRNG